MRSKEQNYLDRIQPRTTDNPGDAFFDQLAKTIIEENQASLFKRPVYKRLAVQVLAVATVIPFIMWWVFNKPDTITNNAFVSLDKVSNETIVTYMHEYELMDTALLCVSASVVSRVESSTMAANLVAELPIYAIHTYLEEYEDDWSIEEVE